MAATGSTKYLIIGGGLAAASAIEQLLQADPGARGAITMVTAESGVPYHRPPLSKGYLLGRESRTETLVKPEEFYTDNGVRVLYRRKARLIDSAARVCELELSESIKFERALIATGASPVRYEGPGRSLEGVHYLRTIQDSDRIRGAMEDMNQAVIVGGGFIGMEIASAFAQKNIKTTVLTRSPVPWDKLGNPEVAQFFRGYFEKRGVRFILNDEPEGFVGTSHADVVVTKNGEKISCGGVVVGIGAKPNTGIAEASRMLVENGIVVDETLQTSTSGVYAAGDVASFVDPVFGRRRRIEHWDNAEKQGQCAGRNLAGVNEKFYAVPMFFSDVFDLSWELWGDAENPDQVINRGEISKESIVSWYIKDGVISGAFLMGRQPEDSDVVRRLIENRTSINGKDSLLRYPNRPLGDLL